MPLEKAAFKSPFRQFQAGHSSDNGVPKVTISLGESLSADTELVPGVRKSGLGSMTVEWYGVARLQIEANETESEWSEYSFSWTPLSRDFVPCDTVSLTGHWFGGAECFEQRWPSSLQKIPMQNYLSADIFASKDCHGSVLERFWISSSGVALHVDDTSPFHIGFNEGGDGKLVLKADYNMSRYKNSDGILPRLKYTIITAANAKAVWLRAYPKFYHVPSALPDEKMLMYPIWSTWARYKVHINQEKVLEFAKEIQDHGFSHSQLEIDDMYTTAYGDNNFDPEKFPDPKQMMSTLNAMGFRVTCWTHPFSNEDSESYKFGQKKKYFLRDSSDTDAASVNWWQGTGVILDVTNKAACDWYYKQLKSFQDKYGLTSFKFDAGEINWLPEEFVSEEDLKNPSEYTTKYVELVEKFGNAIETRVGYNTQRFPIFVRMMDKHSVWDYNNGLKTMIPTALLFGILGYPFVLPDMIGGNGYPTDGSMEGLRSTILPPKELYIRWTQLTAYLPSMQFSIVPWQYDPETVHICKQAVRAHSEIVAPLLMTAAQETLETGTPIIRPLWWADPKDEDALTNDSQFLIGDAMVVAPILEDNGRQRDVYLPKGEWADNLRSRVYSGPLWLRDYHVALNEIATFSRKRYY